MKIIISFIITFIISLSFNTALLLRDFYTNNEPNIQMQYNLNTNFLSILVLALLLHILINQNYKKEKNNYITNQSKRLLKNENDVRLVLIENLRHEISTPLAVLNSKIVKYSHFYPTADKNIIEGAFEQIYNIVNKIHRYKIIKNRDQNLYEVFEFAFESVTIGFSYIEYNIDLSLKHYKTSMNNLDLAGIVINFIKNSIEANSTIINIILDEDEIIIRDNGNGIKQEDIKKARNKNDIRGSGLFINRIILEESKGIMNIIRKENGTDVILKIPLSTYDYDV